MCDTLRGLQLMARPGKQPDIPASWSAPEPPPESPPESPPGAPPPGTAGSLSDTPPPAGDPHQRDPKADPLKDASHGIRIQKVLASSGVASRRACEGLIEEGAIRVNGRLIESLPVWVDPINDRITVHGQVVKTGAPAVCVVLFKPRGIVCTSDDPQGRRRAIDLVDHPSRVRLFTVGRLDIDSSGLIVLTNDGDLSNLLTHPSHHVKRVYDVTVDGEVPERVIDRLARGINIPDDRTGRPRPAKFQSIRVLEAHRDRTRLEVILSEGRNRQVRRMFKAMGFPVRRLRRTAMGSLTISGLRPGQWRDLTEAEVRHLRESAKTTPPKKRRRPAGPSASKKSPKPDARNRNRR